MEPLFPMVTTAGAGDRLLPANYVDKVVADITLHQTINHGQLVLSANYNIQMASLID